MGPSRKPLAIDLFAGLGGWTEGFLAEGYEVVGFDIERHVYGDQQYPAQLVLQDARTIDGKQFRNAAVIVASPPCQRYSYMAMPWTRAKALAAWYREDQARQTELNALFDACFRIQREASAAAGHHIPLVVENVKGAQPWVGRAAWHHGSFYLWGDVPALMPITLKAQKFNPDGQTMGVGLGLPSLIQKTAAPEAQKTTVAHGLRKRTILPLELATTPMDANWRGIAHLPSSHARAGKPLPLKSRRSNSRWPNTSREPISHERS